jgi:ABC-type dipeptide/oligopeptide/nickel transport system ATPase component
LSVAALCHRIAILNAGEIVEMRPSLSNFQRPQHTYTQKLVAALPRLPVFFTPDSLSSSRGEAVLGRT